MKKRLKLLLLLGSLAAGAAAFGQKVTLEQARSRSPDRATPAFWLGQWQGLAARWETLARGERHVIAVSPGGRPVCLVTYGEHEPSPQEANFNSAIAALQPSAYCDKSARKKPVLLFLGPVHGHEVEPHRPG